MSRFSRNKSNYNTNDDLDIPDPPADTVSSLDWSPQGGDFLAAGCWDDKVYCYEVTNDGNASGVAICEDAEAPVLDVCWNGDGTCVFVAGCDQTVKMWDVETGKSEVVAEHQAPVSCVQWIEESNVLVTGSWDGWLCYWDLNSDKPVSDFETKERIYDLDFKAGAGVVACANRDVHCIDLQEPEKPFSTKNINVKHQISSVSCFPNGDGFAVGTIEGRVAVQYYEPPRDASKEFIFKCHRMNDNRGMTHVYSVNKIDFHNMGSVLTCGGDGTFHIWDIDSKQRLKQFENVNYPVTAGAFNADGSLCAYAIGYDWSKGVSGFNDKDPVAIMVHECLEDEVTPK